MFIKVAYIHSNDYSLYDILLDTSTMLNVISRRYQELHLLNLDTYYAMARGYQSENGDITAFIIK